MQLRETLELNIKRLLDFLTYSKNFLIRKSPIKALINNITEGLKGFLTLRKKAKMVQYRLNYNRHQLQKMEQLIAENNQHTFLQGKNLNKMQ